MGQGTHSPFQRFWLLTVFQLAWTQLLCPSQLVRPLCHSQKSRKICSATSSSPILSGLLEIRAPRVWLGGKHPAAKMPVWASQQRCCCFRSPGRMAVSWEHTFWSRRGASWIDWSSSLMYHKGQLDTAYEDRSPCPPLRVACMVIGLVS